MRLQSSPTDGWSALWADPANYLAKIHKTLLERAFTKELREIPG